eukprot:scaffold7042_cov60-Phaeocystis_antarctica.AAC.8
MACESETRLAGIGSLMSGSSSCTAWLCRAAAGSSHGLVATSYACVICVSGLQSPPPAAVCSAGVPQTDCSRRPFQAKLAPGADCAHRARVPRVHQRACLARTRGFGRSDPGVAVGRGRRLQQPRDWPSVCARPLDEFEEHAAVIGGDGELAWRQILQEEAACLTERAKATEDGQGELHGPGGRQLSVRIARIHREA